jgi:hypothetical protein
MSVRLLSVYYGKKGLIESCYLVSNGLKNLEGLVRCGILFAYSPHF